LLNTNYDGYIRDQDSFIQNGKLMLANEEHTANPIQGVFPNGTYNHSSGWVNSMRKRFFNGSNKSVYLEFKATFPEGPKVWPAIWLVTETPVWPPEIDIWEYFGVFFNPAWGVDEMHFRNIWGHYTNTVSHNTYVPWHSVFTGDDVLGWLWTGVEMKWYVNGVELEAKFRGQEIPDSAWPNQDFSLILNNGLMSEVNASLVVNGVGTTFPNYL